MPRTEVFYVDDPRPEHLPEAKLPITREFHEEIFLSPSGFFAKREFQHSRTNGGESAILFHTVYICPVCGEPWLRRTFLPHPSYTRKPPEWKAEITLCPSHGGGLFLLSQDIPSLELFPLSILHHDALLLIQGVLPCK